MLHTSALSDDREICYLSLEYMDPEGAEWAMKKCLAVKFKFHEKTILKDQLFSLKYFGTNEAQCLASKVRRKIKYDKEKVVE